MNAPDLTHQKRLAAEYSLQQIQNGMCLGLGSGSTAAIMIEMLGERVRGGLQVTGIPTSEATRRLAERCGIPLCDFDQITSVDMTIDGADEADEDLNLIKGGGGALLREKIVASLSDRVVIIVDSSKLVTTLGAFPVPVEVVPFARRPITHRLELLGATVSLRTAADGQPFVTDDGHLLLDARFGLIPNPAALAQELDTLPGVMDHGLFVGIANQLVIGNADDIRVLEALP